MEYRYSSEEAALAAGAAGWPVATTADAVRLIAEQAPDVALVDLNLRGGGLAHDLIDRLHGQGIRVVSCLATPMFYCHRKRRDHPGEAPSARHSYSLPCAQLLQTRQRFCNAINRVMIVGHPPDQNT